MGFARKCETAIARPAHATRNCGQATVVVGALISMLLPVLATAAPEVDFVRIPADDVQPGGPSYDYRISRTEIRNDQFIDFLNDAISHRDTPRGAFMYFDIDSGDVYIHTSETGVIGTTGTGTLLFDASENGAIAVEEGAFVLLDVDLASHPVTGVSWYGAVKYCNWLTIDAGMPTGERAYGEAIATNLGDWKPVTISAVDWGSRDLSDDERESLLDKAGFRLPMDAGVDGTHDYGEWYKVAAARRPTDDTVTFDATYGFGRNKLIDADANFSASGDPFEPGTTPVAFFDGVNMLADGATATNDTENAYGVYDLSGNVWEWMQDQAPSNPSLRRNRGGSWRSQPTSLPLVVGAQRSAASATDTTGFRVVQRVVDDLLVTPFNEHKVAGPWGGPYDDPESQEIIYRLTNTTSSPVDYAVSSDAPWLSIDPIAGTVPVGGRIDVVVTIAPECADELEVGDNVGEVRFAPGSEATDIIRTVRLRVAEPLSVSAADPSSIEMRFGGAPTPTGFVFTLDSESETTVNWSATWEDVAEPPAQVTWLTFDGGAQAAGSIDPGGSLEVNLEIDQSVAVTLDAGTYTAKVTFVDECTQTPFVRFVTLDVLPLFAVAPTIDVTSRGLAGGPFDPSNFDFAITNLLDTDLTWNVQLCTEEPGEETCTPPDPVWLGAEPSGTTIAPDESEDVTVSILPAANALEADTHTITVRFVDSETGFFVERLVTLEVEGLQVEPETTAQFTGPLAGPFAPAESVFTLHNNDVGEMDWTATVEIDPLAEPLDALEWFEVDPSAGAILDPGGTSDITVLLTADALALPAGEYHGVITFTANGVTARREVELFVGGEAFWVKMANIPPEDVQSLGPTHHFRIAVHEVTSAEFARFLNDTYRHRTAPRGAFMYHDTDSGSVYIHTGPDGAEGTDAPSETLSTPLYLASAGRIRFNATEQQPYVVDDGFDLHPVTGVSWYGAAKFCNWMTLIQNMPTSARLYAEGPDPSDWRAAVDAPALLELPGFRLPMDGGVGPAAALNEWNKAASRKVADEDGTAIFGAIYGFGRDTIGDADANFRDSGDTEENGATPVGFFDGENNLLDNSSTNDTANGYRLFGMTGNVAEWVHELDDSGPTRLGATRGGHFNHDSSFAQLRSDVRDTLPAESAFSFVGFRVAQSLTPVPLVTTQDDAALRSDGPVGGPYSRENFALQLVNDGNYTLDDTTLSVSSADAWLAFDPAPPRQVPPLSETGSPIDVGLKLSDAADDLSVSPAPSGNMRLISPRTSGGGSPSGPAHDYWFFPTEVTNAEFVSFLNGARPDPDSSSPDPRGAHMYFDTDSGNVYINDHEDGAEGEDAPTETISTLLYDASIGRIRFSNDQYEVDAGYNSHPVVGVTWYGAIKYCNWLTLATGMPEALRAYVEEVDPTLWRPASISADDWVTRDLNDAERTALVRQTIGYRLPMDDGSNNADPEVDALDLFNEWFSAAVFHISDAGGAFDAAFGFGRDALTFADANFLSSGDTAYDGTTPVSFFNGINTLSGTTSRTVKTANGFGLFDLCGNVAEWTQDRYDASGADLRSIRGGSWRDTMDSPALGNEHRVGLAPDTRNDHTGFRVVRGTGHFGKVQIVDGIAEATSTRIVILDLHEPFDVTPLGGITLNGPYCTEFAGQTKTYALRGTSQADIPWQVSVTGESTWLDVTAPVEDELTGTIEGGDDQPIRIIVATNDTADALLPGKHIATISITNTRTGQSTSREVSITVDEPIAAVFDPSNPRPEFQGPWEGPFEEFASLRYTLSRCEECDLDCSLDYEVRATVPWLTIEPADALTGALPPLPESLTFDVSINDAANALPVGNYTGAASFVFVDPETDATGNAIEHTIKLVVKDPIVIQQDFEPWDICCELSESTLPSQTYSLTNTHHSDEIGVTISVNVNWLELDQSVVSVLPGETELVTVSLVSAAIQPHGEYPATIVFQNTAAGNDQTRDVLLRITENLSVTPIAGFETAGPTTGSVDPSAARYTLTNIAGQGASVIEWDASSDRPWIRLNGNDSATGSLGDGESAHVVVQIVDGLLPTMPTGAAELDLQAVVTFVDQTNGETTARIVQLRRTVPRFDLDTALVGDLVQQPAGPFYSFRIGRFHVTSAEFVSFLNDAMLHPSTERGQYMYFDTDTGDVYVNTDQSGEAAIGANERTTLMFAPGEAGPIEFVNGSYRVIGEPRDFASHPVTNVSWFGAVKFCNWLTLDQGMLPIDRCYTENTESDLNGWRPVSIALSDWLSRDLNDAERRELVTECRGFRLPMDDGYANATPSSDTADAYNEWYKAAAWNEALRRNTIYGFGRDTLTDGDANFSCSGDPFENIADCLLGGSTPVGFYDGSAKPTPAGTLMTNSTDNTFGLFDMSGNVHQWIQGRYASPASFDRRTLRGGSWNDPAGSDSLRAARRTLFAPPATTSDQIGFRVVRSLGSRSADGDLDGDIDIDDFTAAADCLHGPERGLISGCSAFDLDSDADVDLLDLAAIQRSITLVP